MARASLVRCMHTAEGWYEELGATSTLTNIPPWELAGYREGQIAEYMLRNRARAEGWLLPDMRNIRPHQSTPGQHGGYVRSPTPVLVGRHLKGVGVLDYKSQYPHIMSQRMLDWGTVPDILSPLIHHLMAARQRAGRSSPLGLRYKMLANSLFGQLGSTHSKWEGG